MAEEGMCEAETVADDWSSSSNLYDLNTAAEG
jgi:hypothetical protein